MENRENNQVEQEPKNEEVVTPESKRADELRRLTKFGTDPTEVTLFISNNVGQTLQDPMDGEIIIRPQLLEEYRKFNLDLGQVAGLIKDGTAYKGTPKKLVDGVLNSLYGPQSIQDAYRTIATKYINGVIAAQSKPTT